MFFNMAVLLEMALVLAFAGFSFGAGSLIDRRWRVPGLLPSLAIAVLLGVLFGLAASLIAHWLLPVLFPHGRGTIQTGNLTTIAFLAIAAYMGIREHRIGAA
jgi:hypothetical protein